jgi:hypothetical protein
MSTPTTTDQPTSDTVNQSNGQAVNVESAALAGGKLRLDTSDLKSSYCNVCNASSTREEVVLSLGVNHNWELERSSGIEVKLLHRIILSPYAAKRLSSMLANLMRDYEARHGELRT